MLHNVTYSKSMNGHPCQLNCFTYNNFLILNNNSRMAVHTTQSLKV